MIDIGTNTIQLLITRLGSTAELQTVDRFKENFRLNTKPNQPSQIGIFEIRRLIEILNTMKHLADPYQPQFRVVATQGLRSAKNHEDLIDLVYRKNGLKIEIVDGHEEARLSFLGMLHACGPFKEPRMFLDIGGGSTEFIVGQDEEIKFLTSLKLGSLRLSQKYFGLDAPSDKQIDDLKVFLEHRLTPLSVQLTNTKVSHGIGTAGTIKNVARIHHFLVHGWLQPDIDGFLLTADAIDTVVAELIKIRNPKKIKEVFGLDTKRSEIILAGAILLNSISRTFGIARWQVSSYGLREGIALDTYARLGCQMNMIERLDQRQQLKNFAARFEVDSSYADQMKAIAHKIFRQIAPTLKIGDHYLSQEELESLLLASAELYEIGKYVSFSAYHKHSYYLITEGHLYGFNQEERHIIALAIHFSRKKPATEVKIKNWPYLKRHFDDVNTLSFCLRLARCLTRSKRGLLNHFQIFFEEDKIRLVLQVGTLKGVEPEFHSLMKEQKNLSRTLQRPLLIEKST